MKNPAHIKALYAHAVCFVSVIIIAVITGLALYNVVSLIAPRATLDPGFLRYLSSNELFINSAEGMYCAPASPYYGFGPGPFPLPEPDDGTGEGAAHPLADLSDEEITELRLDCLQLELDEHSARALNNLVREVIMLLVLSPLFLVHWRLGQNMKQSLANGPEAEES